MSLRCEQQWSLWRTRKFLRALMDSKQRPKTVKALREGAYGCLSHFPPLDERGNPIWSKDKFDCPILEHSDDWMGQA